MSMEIVDLSGVSEEKNSDTPRNIKAGPDDFIGVGFCQTGKDAGLTVILNRNDRPPKQTLYYYVQSLPGTRGKVDENEPLALEFERACKEWSEVVPITFKRTRVRENEDFYIRTANADEERERVTLIAEAFFWSDTDQKVMSLS